MAWRERAARGGGRARRGIGGRPSSPLSALGSWTTGVLASNERDRGGDCLNSNHESFRRPAYSPTIVRYQHLGQARRATPTSPQGSVFSSTSDASAKIGGSHPRGSLSPGALRTQVQIS
jgi:hypothetical protein